MKFGTKAEKTWIFKCEMGEKKKMEIKIWNIFALNRIFMTLFKKMGLIHFSLEILACILIYKIEMQPVIPVENLPVFFFSLFSFNLYKNGKSCIPLTLWNIFQCEENSVTFELSEFLFVEKYKKCICSIFLHAQGNIEMHFLQLL